VREKRANKLRNLGGKRAAHLEQIRASLWGKPKVDCLAKKRQIWPIFKPKSSFPLGQFDVHALVRSLISARPHTVSPSGFFSLLQAPSCVGQKRPQSGAISSTRAPCRPAESEPAAPEAKGCRRAAAQRTKSAGKAHEKRPKGATSGRLQSAQIVQKDYCLLFFLRQTGPAD